MRTLILLNRLFYRVFGILNYVLNRLVSRVIQPRTGFSIENTEKLIHNPDISIKYNQALEIIVTSGNRLEDMKEFMPLICNLLDENTSLALSIHADKEQTSKYLKDHYGDLILSHKLRIIETNAEKFNKAEAINNALIGSKANLIFLLDSDIRIMNENSFLVCSLHFALNNFNLISYGYWGQQLMKKHDLVALGGMSSDFQNHDSKFTSGVYGDDMDLIVRTVASGGKFLFVSHKIEYVFKSLLFGFTVFLKRAREREFNYFVHQKEVSARERPMHDYDKCLYFKRIGGYTPRKDKALICYHAWQKFSLKSMSIRQNADTKIE